MSNVTESRRPILSTLDDEVRALLGTALTASVVAGMSIKLIIFRYLR